MRGYVSTPITTVIDNESFLLNLRVIIFYKLVKPAGTHIRNMDVSDLTVCLFTDVLDILSNPIQVIEI